LLGLVFIYRVRVATNSLKFIEPMERLQEAQIARKLLATVRRIMTLLIMVRKLE